MPGLGVLVVIASAALIGVAGRAAEAKNACVLGRALQEGIPAPTAGGQIVLPARFYLECGQPVPAEALAADPALAG